MAATNATGGLKPDGDRDRRDERDAGQHLGEAEAEDLAPQRPQPRRLQLEADDEEQHHDAELGDARGSMPGR